MGEIVHADCDGVGQAWARGWWYCAWCDVDFGRDDAAPSGR